eukprot:scaffold7740_cov112-Isochrysis_galbana.AAC.13
MKNQTRIRRSLKPVAHTSPQGFTHHPAPFSLCLEITQGVARQTGMLADGRGDHAREQGALVGRDVCELGRLGLFLIPEFLSPFILPHCLGLGVPVARRRAVRLEVQDCLTVSRSLGWSSTMSAVRTPRIIKAPRPTDSNVWSTVPKYSSSSVWCCGRSDCSGGSATLTPRAEPRTQRAGKLSDAGQGFTGPAIPRGCPTGVSDPEVDLISR